MRHDRRWNFFAIRLTVAGILSTSFGLGAGATVRTILTIAAGHPLDTSARFNLARISLPWICYWRAKAFCAYWVEDPFP